MNRYKADLNEPFYYFVAIHTEKMICTILQYVSVNPKDNVSLSNMVMRAFKTILSTEREIITDCRGLGNSQPFSLNKTRLPNRLIEYLYLTLKTLIKTSCKGSRGVLRREH